jgi:hypothetical protein
VIKNDRTFVGVRAVAVCVVQGEIGQPRPIPGIKEGQVQGSE